ncbi:branched-chain amino acid transport protein AzlD [Spirochaetia bacterium]|nr:branched-chain amino acid transport protein AzlD [Spirochaetia bacterium]
MVSIPQALLMTFIMGAVIFFCRVFPFIFFRERKRSGGKASETFLSLVEKTAPPVAMTVLAFNAISGPIKDNIHASIPVLAASAFTALTHLWKRNALISIIGGTLVYMVLSRVLF